MARSFGINTGRMELMGMILSMASLRVWCSDCPAGRLCYFWDWGFIVVGLASLIIRKSF